MIGPVVVSSAGVLTEIIISATFIHAVGREDHLHDHAGARVHTISVRVAGAKRKPVSGLK